MNWLFVFYLCLYFVVSVKCDNEPIQDNWSYTIYYQDENCQTPIKASGVATNTCPPNHNTNQCVDKTVTSCTTTSTLKLTSTFAVLYSYSQDDSNCDKPVSFDALINDQCVDGLKWSYPYIMTYASDCTSPKTKADYGNCNNHQKMMLGGDDSNSADQNTNHSDNGNISKTTLIIVVVVPVVVLIVALLLYRYFVLGQIAFSISAYYSSVQLSQGVAYPAQNDQAVVELPIYEGHQVISDNSTPIYPTYTDVVTHVSPIIEGVAVVMTTNDV